MFIFPSGSCESYFPVARVSGIFREHHGGEQRHQSTIPPFSAHPDAHLAMTVHDTNPTPSDPLTRAFELVSRQIDGNLSAAESEELATVEASNGARIAEFRTGCRRLQTMLRQIPVQSVKGSLWAVPEPAEVNPGLTWLGSRKGVAWGSFAVVIVGCLLLAIVRPWNSQLLSDPQPTMASNNLNFATPQDLDRRLGESSGFRAETAADAFVLAEGSSGSLSERDFLIQPLLESTNWNIVVVHLDEKDRDHAMQRIQSIIHEHGLRLQNATDAGPSDFAHSGQTDFVGVVLTSAVSANDELVTAIERTVTDFPVEREQRGLAETRREEIIEAVRNSLQHPTRSELHHGKVYVALSTGGQNGSTAAGSVLADSATPPTSAMARAAADAEGRVVDGPLAAVTLVVFEFRSNNDNEESDSSKPSVDKGPGPPL